MKSKYYSILIASLLLIVSFPSLSSAMWYADDDEGMEIEELIRVDGDPDAPYHELEEGVYGYYDDQQQLVLVLDFNTTEVYIAPFNETNTEWIPGELDKPGQGS